MRMFYLLPPSGTPISFSDMANITSSRLGFGQGEESLAKKLTRFTGSKHVWTLNSGRTALLVLLRGLSQLASLEKTEVVIPSWTCFSVAASIARAGLKIRLVDIDPMTLDYDYNQLCKIDLKPVLAIIACNLFGIISDWSRLHALAEGQPVFLIDDAAQAFGSMVAGRASGTLGDVGIYSLDRGKNLSTWSGGVIVTNNDKLAAGLEKIIEPLPTPGIVSETVTAMKMGLYSVLLRPNYYWIPNMLPFLGLGQTVYSEEFATTKLSLLQRDAGALLIDKLDRLNRLRSACAAQLAERIGPLGKFAIPGSEADRETTFLRLPLLAADQVVRKRAIDRLREGGITASAMYPATIRDIAGIEPRLASLDNDYPGGQRVVSQLLALPTHYFVRQADIDKIVLILSQV